MTVQIHDLNERTWEEVVRKAQDALDAAFPAVHHGGNVEIEVLEHAGTNEPEAVEATRETGV